ncbi:MAG: hypothetical protein ABS85_13550 [Sphingobacteriales bacterium SCN 48-20]|uniref:T9SS type B sorting domain-containing protein n=1 Tax=Terrimonas ferruginea TaxID=249 RepID=UPI00086D9611|nr:gliding motility-associated C-terminal domain-containing protein [Terrimonas ferruginea]MBN8781746.1 gliding motility-associated C-terminal domain-containing protein [Terrimonas ferruginea]ODT91103.1 MAG: hypothetical protein ABS85_13550 [Sphingobacteriales bacterium SCN 48-20]OJW44896.1 MAG: hypothetical protein BGO56_15715 [Sphingobacteriales bacterium 48-107]
MRKVSLLLAVICIVVTAKSQNPATVFYIANDTVRVPCGATCATISFQVPHIKQTSTYTVTNPQYLPYAYKTTAGTELTALYTDDRFSAAIPFPIGFSFCFYGIDYSSAVVGSNSIITFNASHAGQTNAWPLATNSGNGTPIPIPYAGGSSNTASPAYYPGASIMGPYHDVYPTNTYGGERKIEWRVEGTAPKRRFIASYNQVPLFDCEDITATSQMVIYENTGIVEVYIKDKPVCAGWNSGLAILGVQNATRDNAVTAPGKNATVWGRAGMDSCFRFVPSGGTPMFKRAELLLNNVVIATNTTDTSSAAGAMLNVNFANVCPTADSTAYGVRVVYASCSNPNIEVSFLDTIYVKKSVPIVASVTSVNPTCTAGGSITVQASGGAPPLSYSINNGTTTQSGNVFTNVQAGTYNVVVTDAAGFCRFTQTATLTLQGAVTVNAGADTAICTGASFTRGAVSNATTYSWSPTTGVSAPTSPAPVFSPTQTTTYTVTASTANCTATDAFVVTVAPGATIDAGPDAFVITGQQYTMQASGSTGSYLWSPSAGLSSATVLNPTVSLNQTTTYTLEVTTPQGCKATDQVTLTLLPNCLRPMEAFTPNGDGVNDLWLVTTGSCLKSADVQVFNRYGAKVYESRDYRNTWDGTYKGKPLPDGTYYFVISYELVNGKKEHLKGNLTILR